MYSIEDAKKALEFWIRMDKEALDKWAAEFTEDPNRAIANSDDIFRKAARLSISTKLLKNLNKQNDLEFVIKYARKEMKNGARSPLRSTSITSNLQNQAETAAWAEIVAVIGDNDL